MGGTFRSGDGDGSAHPLNAVIALVKRAFVLQSRYAHTAAASRAFSAFAAAKSAHRISGIRRGSDVFLRAARPGRADDASEQQRKISTCLSRLFIRRETARHAVAA